MQGLIRDDVRFLNWGLAKFRRQLAAIGEAFGNPRDVFPHRVPEGGVRDFATVHAFRRCGYEDAAVGGRQVGVSDMVVICVEGESRYARVDLQKGIGEVLEAFRGRPGNVDRGPCYERGLVL